MCGACLFQGFRRFGPALDTWWKKPRARSRGLFRLELKYMSQITVSHLTFAYDGACDNVFEDVSFVLDTIRKPCWSGCSCIARPGASCGN